MVERSGAVVSLSGVLANASVVLVLAAMAVLVIYLHRANIARLMRGEEPKVGGKK